MLGATDIPTTARLIRSLRVLGEHQMRFDDLEGHGAAIGRTTAGRPKVGDGVSGVFRPPGRIETYCGWNP